MVPHVKSRASCTFSTLHEYYCHMHFSFVLLDHRVVVEMEYTGLYIHKKKQYMLFYRVSLGFLVTGMGLKVDEIVIS